MADSLKCGDVNRSNPPFVLSEVEAQAPGNAAGGMPFDIAYDGRIKVNIVTP